MSNDFEWKIDLPENCPPEDAHECNGNIFYRIVERDVSENDFVCNRKKRPEKNYERELCDASGTSIFDDEIKIKSVLGLPAIKNDYSEPCVAKIKIYPDDGLVKKTRGPFHYTFWRSKAFDYQDTIDILD